MVWAFEKTMRGSRCSRSGRRIVCGRYEFRTQNDYPYAIYFCNDRIVMVNRFYEPIWQIGIDGNGEYGEPVICWDAEEPVIAWNRREYFYDSAMSEKEKRRRAMDGFAAWGITDPWPANATAVKDRLLRLERRAWAEATRRWTVEDLAKIDPEMAQAIQEQGELFRGHLNSSLHEAEAQGQAMIRGWAAMKRRFEDEAVDKALAVTVTRKAKVPQC